MWKTREGIAAGAYNQRANTAASSFTGLNTASLTTMRNLQVTNPASLADLQVSSLTGAAGYRGIATMNSGTNVVSVAATAAQSGAVIVTQIIQYVNDVSSQAGVATAVQSVRAGAFEIVAVGSRTPLGNMPVAWFIIR